MVRFVIIVFLFLFSCLGIPDGVSPVNNFDLSRYLGTWYEIARLDHSFERGLSQVSADYRLNSDGSVSVINRGFSEKSGWKEARGRALFVKEKNQGYLKVSFFGPFYGSYIILDLDKEYKYSVVSGPDKSYLWILSRKPVLEKKILDNLVKKAEKLGYNTDNLIFVNHY